MRRHGGGNRLSGDGSPDLLRRDARSDRGRGTAGDGRQRPDLSAAGGRAGCRAELTPGETGRITRPYASGPRSPEVTMRAWLGLLAVSITMVVVGALLFWRGHGHGHEDGDGGFRVTSSLPVQTETTFDWQGRVSKGQALFLRDVNGDITVTAATGQTAEVHAVKDRKS